MKLMRTLTLTAVAASCALALAACNLPDKNVADKPDSTGRVCLRKF